MKKEIMNLLNNTSITEKKADKALTVLGDLLQDYAFMDDEPTQKEAEKYAWEAKRIFHFIDISFDYVYDIKKEVSKAYDDLNNLHDLNKKANEAPTDGGEICKEQINAVLNNLDEAELLQVYEYALNLMMPRRIEA